VGLDVTPQMLQEAIRKGRDRSAALINGDAAALPIPTGTISAIFAAGLIHHLPDPAAGLAELARVTATGGRLAIFHPISRSQLAARHGHQPSEDDPLAESNITGLLARSGWTPLTVDDGNHGYLVLAARS
jgi:ubiquinone/menaquinone biosynthesis C-methylase UbiE